MSVDADPAVYVVKGAEEALVTRALDGLLASLTAPGEAGGGLQAMGVEEHRAPNRDDELPIDLVLDALFTPPFFADRRIVVLRDAERLTASQTTELTGRLGESFEPNVLVLTFVGKPPPAAVTKLVKSKGTEIDSSPPGSGKARSQWLIEQLHTASVHLDAAAGHLLQQHLGEDVARLHALVDVLSAAYGEGARIGPEELEPFLGEEGGAPPWDLTDALDGGDIAAAVRAAHRLLGPGERHPLQLLSTLHRHYGAMLRLDGSGVTDANQAASMVGMAPYPTRKVLEQGRRLGHERIARAIDLLADADLALRGTVDWPDELVIEVLVARLAQLAGGRGPSAAGASRRPARAR
jgi:DNA polymerase-3 subunit delta